MEPEYLSGIFSFYEEIFTNQRNETIIIIIKAKVCVIWGGVGMGMKTTAYSKDQDCPQVEGKTLLL